MINNTLINNTTIDDKDNKFPDGEFYEVDVPDTLDLAINADYAINCLTGTIKPEQCHEALWNIQLAPFAPHDHGHEWFDSSPRTLEALTLMRVINGSRYGFDKEEGLLNAMINRIGEDGLVYNLPFTPDAYWRYKENTGARHTAARPDDEVCSITVNAMLSIALMQRYERDDISFMLETATKLIRALIRIAIHKEDYAYYPPTPNERFEFSYYKKGGWPDTKEALSELDNQEGAVTCYIALIIRALTRFYALTGDKDAISLAAKLVTYVLKPQFWLGNMEKWSKGEWVPGLSESVWEGHGGAQRKPAAHFRGHMSGIAYALEALIDYASQANDAYVKEFVRQGYEFYRNLGLSRIGCWGENIANSYLAGIAIKLSDAGAGDFWEDVDQYVRNQIVEDQITDIDVLKALCDKNGFSYRDDKYRYGRFVRRLLNEVDENGQSFCDDFASDTSSQRDIIQKLCEKVFKKDSGNRALQKDTDNKALQKDADNKALHMNLDKKLTAADMIIIERYKNGEIDEAEALKAICDNHGFDYGEEEYNLERFLGGLTHYNNIDRQGTLDPTSNFAQIACPYHEPMYYVWEGITRFNNGMAEINLLLNRSAPWVDIDSYLPYEGRVIIRNKTASQLAVRIPKWVDRKALKCKLNDSEKQYCRVGNYITVAGITSGDIVEITFPMVESVETYYLIGIGKSAEDWYKNTDRLPKYTLHLRGNTCVKIEFPERDRFLTGCYNPEGEKRRIPAYQREHMRSGKAPMKKVRRYVSKNCPSW